jgi:NAD(P)-dependent dehydrogenase (short-subunit alcohol dehydrogenase family)
MSTDFTRICSSTVFNCFHLQSRVAMVTGSHRGIGREIAAAYAEAGAVVYCIDLPQKPDNEWLDEKKRVESFELQIDNKERRRGRMEYVRGDVTDPKQMKEIVEKIKHEQGRLDVCVACAGILNDGDSIQFPPDEFTKARFPFCDSKAAP